MQEDSKYYTYQFKWRSIKDTWRCLAIPVWLKPIALIVTTLRYLFQKKTATYGFPLREWLEIVNEADVPPELTQQFEPTFQAIEAEGFSLQFIYCHRGIGAIPTTTYAAVFLDSASTSFVTVAGESASPRKVLFPQTRLSIQSRLTDGSLLITTRLNKHAYIANEQPSHWRVEVLPVATAESDALTTHLARLKKSSARPIALDRQALEHLIPQELRTIIDFAVEQGWYRFLTEDEVDTLLFATAEQKRADEKKLRLSEPGEEAKRIAREKRLSWGLLFGIGVILSLAVFLGRRAQQTPLANFLLKTPDQTIAFEITHDVNSISCWADQHPPGPDTWGIQQCLGSVREIGITQASIEPDVDQQRVHFQIGTKRVDFDLRLLEFVPSEAKQN